MTSDEPIADLNPFAESLAAVNATIATLVKKKETIQRKLKWHKATNRRAVAEKLQAKKAKADLLEAELRKLEAKAEQSRREQAQLSARLGTLLNPLNWFDADQQKFRIRMSQLLGLERQTEKRRGECDKSLKRITQQIKRDEEILQRYDSFDPSLSKEQLRALKGQIVEQKEQSKRLAVRKDELDEALEPLLQDMDDLVQRRQAASSDLSRAVEFQGDLSRAGNPYKRAKIHQKCEEEFGEGKPTVVENQRKIEIERLDRDLKKLQERARGIARRASQEIETLVLDGNNLCYEAGQFIGLAALETLVPILKPRYSIVIVFHPSILRKLSSSARAINHVFGDDIVVHVASSQTANETVLQVATRNKETFVVSNNRFVEYNDMAPVSDNRILRHEIVKGHVYVHDLGVEAAYR